MAPAGVRRFPVVKGDAKIDYMRTDLRELTLGDNTNSNLPYPYRSRQETLGSLEILPPEMQLELLSHFDLKTLIEFRKINRKAKDLVDALSQYRDIRMHALQALSGILQTGVGSRITCKTLHEKLCTAGCEDCGKFAGYLYILTCKRVCRSCLTSKREYLPVSRDYAKSVLGLDKEALRAVPSMMPVTGQYGPYRFSWSSQGRPYYDYDAALQASIAMYGSEEAIRKHERRVVKASNEEYREKAKANGISVPNRGPRQVSRRLTTWILDKNNPQRWIAVVRTPWLDKSKHESILGSYCAACNDRILYIGDEIEEHASRCLNIIPGATV
ncbi:hypothetical protein F5Y18DRAFT_434648 [Xylariaceae sp. FL1019]|nr:hypothetical protein F5Y18DRAFT_434648 [Xylariaceae sp. FL1019]